MLLQGIKAGFLCGTHSNWSELAGFLFNMKSLEKGKTLDLSKNQNFRAVYSLRILSLVWIVWKVSVTAVCKLEFNHFA